MRSTTIVTSLAVLAIFVGCGSAGNGGEPTPAYSSSDAPPFDNGAATPTTGKNGNPDNLPGRTVPGSGSGLGAGASTGATGGDCKSACAVLAQCGATQKDCLQSCSLVEAACVQCIANATCTSFNDCDSACGIGASTGTGGSSSGQGAGGNQGGGGSQTKTITCHDLTACCGAATLPADQLAACGQIASSGSDKSCKSAYQAYAAAGYCP